MSPRGGPRPGAGRPLPEGQTRRIRLTAYITPSTMHALNALALPHEAPGATIERIISEKQLTPPWVKVNQPGPAPIDGQLPLDTHSETGTRLPHPLHYAPTGKVCPLCGLSDSDF